MKLPRWAFGVMAALGRVLLGHHGVKMESKLINAVWAIARRGEEDDYCITDYGNALLVDLKQGTSWWLVYGIMDIPLLSGVISQKLFVETDVTFIRLSPTHISEPNVGLLFKNLELAIKSHTEYYLSSNVACLDVYNDIKKSLSISEWTDDNNVRNIEVKSSYNRMGNITSLSVTFIENRKGYMVKKICSEYQLRAREFIINLYSMLKDGLRTSPELRMNLAIIEPEHEWLIKKIQYDLPDICKDLVFKFSFKV